MSVVISRSFLDGNKWFIYRPHGIEVVITIVKNNYASSRFLTVDEFTTVKGLVDMNHDRLI